VPEAPLEDSGSGLAPAGDGWFVLNVRDAAWMTAENSENKPPGSDCRFESREFPFSQLGLKIRVLDPGQPNGLYHSENQQEAFLVLFGECRLLVEGEERMLKPWDFFNCPPGTEHIFVGAGAGPCAILMVRGSRRNSSTTPCRDSRHGTARASRRRRPTSSMCSHGSSRHAASVRRIGTRCPGRRRVAGSAAHGVRYCADAAD